MQFQVPILVIIFNRPHLVQLLFNEIRKQKPKYLYISCDGPRVDKCGEEELINQSKEIFSKIDWDCEVATLYRDENWGAGKSIYDSLVWFFKQVDEGIVFEEDCFPHQDFFQYCKELLERYRNCEEIMFIGGNNFNSQLMMEHSYYFSSYAHIWGWASWKRAFEGYSFNLKDVKSRDIKRVLKNYNFSWSEKMVWFDKFKRIQMGQINSWDYQLVFNIWNKKGISIIPSQNLVKHNGFGENAIHCKDMTSDFAKLTLNPILPLTHPEFVYIDSDQDKAFFNKYWKKSIIQLLWRFVYRHYFSIFKKRNYCIDK